MNTPRVSLSLSIFVAIALLFAVPAEPSATGAETVFHLIPVSQTRADAGVSRDHRGRIARSAAAKLAFKHQQPCPITGQSRGPCPGYVIDHIHPLKRGGPDAPENMQWQTVQDAKIKDRTE